MNDSSTVSRFWIADINTSHYLFQWMPDWFGVVDEEVGGIIAYFNNEASADLFIQTLTGKLRY